MPLVFGRQFAVLCLILRKERCFQKLRVGDRAGRSDRDLKIAAVADKIQNPNVCALRRTRMKLKQAVGQGLANLWVGKGRRLPF